MNPQGLAAVVLSTLACGAAGVAVVQGVRAGEALAGLEERVEKLAPPKDRSREAPVSASEREALKKEIEALRLELQALRAGDSPENPVAPDPAAWEKAVEAVMAKKKADQVAAESEKFAAAKMTECGKTVELMARGLKLEGDSRAQLEGAIRDGFRRLGGVLATGGHPDAMKADMEQIRADVVAAIKLQMTPEQQASFDNSDHSWLPGPVQSRRPGPK